MSTRWHVHAGDASWLAAVLAAIARAEAEALGTHGEFHIVLAGGGTPRLVYEALAREKHDWPRWRVWFGDERCLPVDHPERNSWLARHAWLERVAMPAGNIHIIPAELGARLAAERYAEALRLAGTFDLVLLGLGEDGHTASLFPGNPLGEAKDAPDTLPVFDAPKAPPERVSLSARRLSDARNVFFLVTGSGKRAAVAAWRGGSALPVAAIQPPSGVDVFTTGDALSDR
jgi:6-phosphogluconolactonase